MAKTKPVHFDVPQTWYRISVWNGDIVPVLNVVRATRTQCHTRDSQGYSCIYYRMETFPTFEEAREALLVALHKRRTKKQLAIKQAEEELVRIDTLIANVKKEVTT